MIDVDRLNNTISELEQQSEKMKTISEIYEQLSDVSEEVAATTNSQKETFETFEGIGKQLINLKDENKELINEIGNSNEKITKDIKELEVDILKNVQALCSENNKLYIDFQQFLNSKLELFKSDVQLEIRETANRLDNSLNSNINTMKNEIKIAVDENKSALSKIESHIDTSFKTQNKKVNINQIILVIILVISIVNLIMKFL